MGQILSCPSLGMGLQNKCFGTVICSILNPRCGERKSRRVETMKYIDTRADNRENTPKEGFKRKLSTYYYKSTWI